MKKTSRQNLFYKSLFSDKNRKKLWRHFKFADEQELDGLVPETETEDENEAAESARPRRMSEVNAATTIQPIPPASSFFIFSQSNRFHFFLLSWFRLEILFWVWKIS